MCDPNFREHRSVRKGKADHQNRDPRLENDFLTRFMLTWHRSEKVSLGKVMPSAGSPIKSRLSAHRADPASKTLLD